MVIEACVLTRRCRPSNGRAIDLLQRVVPADVGEAAMARPASPFRAVGVEVAVLKEGSGTAVSGQVGGAQLHGRVGERVRWVYRAVTITAPAWASQGRWRFRSLSLPAPVEKRWKNKLQ